MAAASSNLAAESAAPPGCSIQISDWTIRLPKQASVEISAHAGSMRMRKPMIESSR
jgi:hypothetical protein